MSQFTKGVTVKISKNPHLSIEKFGGKAIKLKMAGSIRKIYAEKDESTVYIASDNGDIWTFCHSDLSIAKLKRRSENPTTFDLDNLVL